ncbi:DUF4344 domain-containing metallopeptidase [Planktotalea sp.]|uniref:DUF4344 domain-containing metallopeptidase n=1 Tax=Planktotalea sp. TaxID=2029877 RepID=UPI0025EDEEE2|nr:DUF4344 domain-containing metallopeptidase [Planktotalea sp.]
MLIVTDNNLLTIFYHELGHAVIHQMQVPIFGQEEDAADTLSILMIDALYEPDAAEEIAYDSAALFWAEAQNDPAYWDTHGPDEQRYFNTVACFMVQTRMGGKSSHKNWTYQKSTLMVAKMNTLWLRTVGTRCLMRWGVMQRYVVSWF